MAGMASRCAVLMVCLAFLGIHSVSVQAVKGIPELRWPGDMSIPARKFGCSSTTTELEGASLEGQYFTFWIFFNGSFINVQNGTNQWLIAPLSFAYDQYLLGCTCHPHPCNTPARYELRLQRKLYTDLFDPRVTNYKFTAYGSYCKVQCPIFGSNVTYRWIMNNGDNYGCQSSLDTNHRCWSCNTSCNIEVGDLGSFNEPACLSAPNTSSCFFRQQDDLKYEITTGGDCFGCLRCIATNEFMDVTESLTYDSRIETKLGPCGDGCNSSIYANSIPVVSPPANNIIIGDSVTISLYLSSFPYFVQVYNETSGMSIELDDRSQFRTHREQISATECTHLYTFTIVHAELSHTGVLLFHIAGFIPRNVSVMIQVQDRPCRNAHVSCNTGGQCVEGFDGVQRCGCHVPWFGRRCQFPCLSRSGPFTAGSQVAPIGCQYGVDLQCNTSQASLIADISWSKDGNLVDPFIGVTYPLNFQSFNNFGAGIYTCHVRTENGSRIANSIELVVADDPILNMTLKSQYERQVVSQSGLARIPVILTQTFDVASLTYSWTKNGTGPVCGGSPALCILSKQSPTLLFRQVPGCEGTYTGCAQNSYGDSCITVEVAHFNTTCSSSALIARTTNETNSSIYVLGGDGGERPEMFMGDEFQCRLDSAVSYMESSCCRTYSPCTLAAGCYEVRVGTARGLWCSDFEGATGGPLGIAAVAGICVGAVCIALLVAALVIIVRHKPREPIGETSRFSRPGSRGSEASITTPESLTTPLLPSAIPTEPLNIQGPSGYNVLQTDHASPDEDSGPKVFVPTVTGIPGGQGGVFPVQQAMDATAAASAAAEAQGRGAEHENQSWNPPPAATGTAADPADLFLPPTALLAIPVEQAEGGGDAPTVNLSMASTIEPTQETNRLPVKQIDGQTEVSPLEPVQAVSSSIDVMSLAEGASSSVPVKEFLTVAYGDRNLEGPLGPGQAGAMEHHQHMVARVAQEDINLPVPPTSDSTADHASPDEDSGPKVFVPTVTGIPGGQGGVFPVQQAMDATAATTAAAEAQGRGAEHENQSWNPPPAATGTASATAIPSTAPQPQQNVQPHIAQQRPDKDLADDPHVQFLNALEAPLDVLTNV